MPDPDDDDDYADDLIDLGVDKEQIEAARTRAAAFDDDEDDEVVVWFENADILHVFASCRWRSQIVASSMGSVRIVEGIDAVEIRQVCDLRAVPRARWPDVLWGVRVMEAVALPLLNERR